MRKLGLSALGAALLLCGAAAQATTYNITTSGTTAGFWRVDCAVAVSAPQCVGAGGAVIEVPFLSVTPSPTQSTGTIDIDLTIGAITGGSYAVDGTGDIVAMIDIGILFGLPNGLAFANLSINDSVQTWLPTAGALVGEDISFLPGVFTDPSASSVTCAPAGAVCGSATVLAIIADGGLPQSHAPDPTANLLFDFNAAQTSFTAVFMTDTFTVNDPATCGTAANAIPCFVLGTRTIGTNTVTGSGGVVPEPGTLLLMGSGTIGLALIGRRRRS